MDGQESSLARPELNDQDIVRFLLCYLLWKLERDVTSEELYKICVCSEIINYFFYQDAMLGLIDNGTLVRALDKNGNEIIVLTVKGVECAKQFRSYIPRYFRRRLLSEAITYFYNEKIKAEIVIEYIELEHGWHVHIRCLDVGADLLEMKLYAPNREQAELIGKRVAQNPVSFYGNVIGFALDNEPVKIEPEDI